MTRKPHIHGMNYRKKGDESTTQGTHVGIPQLFRKKRTKDQSEKVSSRKITDLPRRMTFNSCAYGLALPLAQNVWLWILRFHSQKRRAHTRSLKHDYYIMFFFLNEWERSASGAISVVTFEGDAVQNEFHSHDDKIHPLFTSSRVSLFTATTLWCVCLC